MTDRQPLIVQGHQGLGDQVLQAPAVHSLAQQYDVYLETPWPQLWSSRVVTTVDPGPTTLRMQERNRARDHSQELYQDVPHDAEELNLLYQHRPIYYHTVDEIASRAGVHPSPGWAECLADRSFVRDMPIDLSGSYVFVRPPTTRSSWSNPARDPDPDSWAYLMGRLEERVDRIIVGGATLDEGETTDYELPSSDEVLLSGELDVGQLMVLVARADLVVGSVSWLLPWSYLLSPNRLILWGGYIDPGKLALTPMGVVAPMPVCSCQQKSHDCQRHISEERLDRALEAAL